MNFLRPGCRKLSSDRQTDRQTHARSYIARRFAGGEVPSACRRLRCYTRVHCKRRGGLPVLEL